MKIVIVVDRTPSVTVTSISKETLCSKLSSTSNCMIPRLLMENMSRAFPFTPSPITAVIENTSSGLSKSVALILAIWVPMGVNSDRDMV